MENNPSSPSRTMIMGENFLLSLLAAIVVTSLVTFIYLFIALVIPARDKTESLDLTHILSACMGMFLTLFKVVGTCVIPIIFIVAFALLQRFRIK